MALKIDVKFEGKLSYAYKNEMRNLANLHRLKLFGAMLVFYAMLSRELSYAFWHKVCNVDAVVKTVNLTNVDAVKLVRF